MLFLSGPIVPLAENALSWAYLAPYLRPPDPDSRSYDEGEDIEDVRALKKRREDSHIDHLRHNEFQYPHDESAKSLPHPSILAGLPRYVK